jgi:ABC-2 type transport system ATP-binding protein
MSQTKGTDPMNQSLPVGADQPKRRPAAISASGLVRCFAGVPVVDRLDLEVQAGEVYGFLGPNGAGKTTTVRMLCTLLAPTDGRAVVAGHDVTVEPDRVRLRIGVALQDVALDPRQTGEELLRLQGRLYGLTRLQIDRRLADLTDLIDLDDALGRPIATYSGGMSRRLDLAAALVHDPEVLFLDEPTTGLDPSSRHRVWDEVRRLDTELGITVLLTTQYLQEADELAGRVGIIDKGRLVAEGTPAELKRTVGSDVIVAQLPRGGPAAHAAVAQLPDVTGVELHGDELLVTAHDGPAGIGRVALALHRCGAELQGLTLRTTTLDDVFLELTGSRIRPRPQGRRHQRSTDDDHLVHTAVPDQDPPRCRPPRRCGA